MKLENVISEGNLRNWLTDNIGVCEGRLSLEWIEPNMYGSSVGAPDLKVHGWNQSVGLELKYLTSTRKGIKWDVRPAQRRWHHIHVKNGGRSALIAYITATNQLLLVRGDHIPLRPYARDSGSGCPGGVVIYEELNYMGINTDEQAIFALETHLFDDDEFWK